MPVRRLEPVYVPTRSSKYGTHHDYGIDDSINRADYLSNAVLYDTYEAAKSSRGKDHALLRNVNAAIAEAPWYLRARGGSLPPPDSRSVRATSVPPRPRKAPQAYKPPPEPLPTANLRAHRPVDVRSDVLRAVRARSLEPARRADYQADLIYQSSIPSTQLWAHRPVVLRKDAGLLARAQATQRQSYPRSAWSPVRVSSSFDRASDYYFKIPDVQERSVTRSVYTQRGRTSLDSKPPRPLLGSYSKAAIIGSRLEASDVGRSHRRPRSDYAASKLRELK